MGVRSAEVTMARHWKGMAEGSADELRIAMEENIRIMGSLNSAMSEIRDLKVKLDEERKRSGDWQKKWEDERGGSSARDEIIKQLKAEIDTVRSGIRIEVTKHIVTKGKDACLEIGDLLRVYNDGSALISNIRFGPVRWEATVSGNQRTLNQHPIVLLPALSPLPSKESQETRLFVEGTGTMHFYQLMRSNIPNDAAVTVKVVYESGGNTFAREFALNSQPDKDHTIIWNGGPVKLVNPSADAASGGI